ncbi:hypothetical protein GCM10020218_068080 [Dactylosporangium vinaceum]
MYRPDHTAHIRADLARSAMYFGTGLAVVLAAAVTTVLILQVADGTAAPAWLIRTLWVVGSFAVTVSLVGLLLTLVRWLVYLRRRAELDAAGAEAVGEVYARMADRRREP